MVDNIVFAHPYFFWLMLLIPMAVAWYMLTLNRQDPSLRLSSTKAFKKGTGYMVLRHLLFAMQMLAVAAIIAALARPQTSDVTTKVKKTEGIDIVMAIDMSSSMLAKDLKPDRLTALIEVASEFVKKRPNDRIGIVAYAGESYTRTPITSDKKVIQKALKEMEFGELEDGTAIGTGLATAVNRLKDSKALSKVIILLTDGVNNSGFIEPKTAADLAVEFDIKTYTIGLGTNGMAVAPVSYNNREGLILAV